MTFFGPLGTAPVSGADPATELQAQLLPTTIGMLGWLTLKPAGAIAVEDADTIVIDVATAEVEATSSHFVLEAE